MSTEGHGLLVYLAEVPDPRIDRTKLHRLIDILAIAVCAMLAKAESWVEVEEFGRAKEAWLRSFLELPNGIPSHDTFGRVFRLLAPDALTRALVAWVRGLSDLTGDVIALDGKSVRRSFDTETGQRPLHLVSAYAAQARLVLAQVATAEKSNEITAMPEVLDLLDLAGCVVTTDAMGCQKAVAEKVIEKGGDYLLALKGNHPQLHREVALAFESFEADGWKGIPHAVYEETDKGHGRIENRRCVTTSHLDWCPDRSAWKGLKSFSVIDSTRIIGDQQSTERRYYLGSLDGKDAARIARAIREHWTVENELHWVLDVVFDEDRSRIRKDHAAVNSALLRKFALNLIRSDTSSKKSVRTRRLRAALDDDYRLRLLTTALKP